MTLNQNETCTLAMRYKQILLGLILFVLLGGFLQITGKFHFFYIEQLQLFQFSEDYLADKIRAFHYRSYTYVYRLNNEGDHPAN